MADNRKKHKRKIRIYIGRKRNEWLVINQSVSTVMMSKAELGDKGSLLIRFQRRKSPTRTLKTIVPMHKLISFCVLKNSGA
jgi:hypothetical protein